MVIRNLQMQAMREQILQELVAQGLAMWAGAQAPDAAALRRAVDGARACGIDGRGLLLRHLALCRRWGPGWEQAPQRERMLALLRDTELQPAQRLALIESTLP